MSTTSVMGGIVRRKEDPSLVRGKGLYVDDKKLTLKDSTWTISTKDSTVPAANHYDFVTVDLEAFKGMDGDDVVKKSRKWLTSSQSKQPAVACQFDDDGTPVIYHLDY